MKIELENCSLTFIQTLGCNAVCQHCYLSCTPAKARYRLTGQEMSTIIRQAHEAGICSVCFSGGEPFIFSEDLFEAVCVAASLEMHIAIRTNGFWAIDDKTTEKIMTFLACNGVKQLGLSYDNYHAPYVDLSCIKRVFRIAEQFKLEVWLDWVGMESHKEVWQIFGSKYMKRVRAVVPPNRVGRAKSLSETEFYCYTEKDIEFDSCHSFKCDEDKMFLLDVYPDGYVSLSHCCLSHRRFIRRMARDDGWIERLARDMETDVALNFLADYGVGGLIRKAKRSSPSLFPISYSDDCAVCDDLLDQLFPIKNAFDISNLGGNGNYHKARFMSERLSEIVPAAINRFVEEVEGGYMVKSKPILEAALAVEGDKRQ